MGSRVCNDLGSLLCVLILSGLPQNRFPGQGFRLFIWTWTENVGSCFFLKMYEVEARIYICYAIGELVENGNTLSQVPGHSNPYVCGMGKDNLLACGEVE